MPPLCVQELQNFPRNKPLPLAARTEGGMLQDAVECNFGATGFLAANYIQVHLEVAGA